MTWHESAERPRRLRRGNLNGYVFMPTTVTGLCCGTPWTLSQVLMGAPEPVAVKIIRIGSCPQLLSDLCLNLEISHACCAQLSSACVPLILNVAGYFETHAT